MSNEAAQLEGYLKTIGRIEPDIHMIDAGAAYASVAISLKRIADSLERLENSDYRQLYQAIENAIYSGMKTK